MEIIRQYAHSDAEYQTLEKAAAILTAISRSGITYAVEDTYFDLGQNWLWTTIIAYDPAASFGSYQALCPRDYEIILTEPDLLTAINKITDNRRRDKWNTRKDW